MQVQIKRIYQLPTPDDGTRVLVDRLWPRGISKERAQLDFWIKEVAPSPALRRWFGHDPDRWTMFRQRYLEELEQRPELLRELNKIASRGPLTLIYATRDIFHNEARVLADYLSSTAAPKRGTDGTRR